MQKSISSEEAKELNLKLVQAFESMATKHTFKPKQIVRWKKGLKNKAVPAYNEPAIVWEVLPKPVFDIADAHGAGSPYFNEPLDVILAVLDEDDDFIMLHYDSRRFEPIP
jgi:hypothetical protein